jgi:hypothetical protein
MYVSHLAAASHRVASRRRRIFPQYVPVSDPFSGVTRDFWRAAGKIGEDCDVRDDLPSR